ncbi:MAG: ArsR/SmtB family transcription factor [Gemmatimonadaceae bacterium]
MVYNNTALDRTFAALSDRTRRQILARLAGGERTISDLAAGFEMSLPAVSKHVRVLERAGLASVHKQGRVRMTRLVARPMRDAAAWMERYRRFWEHQLDLLAAYLEQPPPDRSSEDQTSPVPRRRSPKTSPPESAAPSRRPARKSSVRRRPPRSSSAGTRRE